MLVEFKTDIYPYCKGDVVKLDEAEKARVDEAAEARDIAVPYVEVKAEKEKTEKKEKE